MSRAELFLKRQKKAKVLASSTSAARAFSDGSQSYVAEPKPQPVVPERPVPVFTSPDVGLSAPSRRKWPGVLCGVIGGLILLGGIGRLMDSSDRGGSAMTCAPMGSGSEDNVSADAADRMESYFNIDLKKVHYWYRQVCISPHVSYNKQYAALAIGVLPCYEEEDLAVNAYATHVRVEGDKRAPAIILNKGAVWFSRIASIAAAAQIRRQDDSFQRFLNAFRQKDLVEMSKERVDAILRQTGVLSASDAMDVLVQAEPISDGMIIGVLAHEFGHLAYGHVSGGRESSVISRNQERDADSFASSVIDASFSPQPMLLGTLIWHYAMAQVEKAHHETASTHPASIERYNDFVHRHMDVAHSLGIGKIE